MVEICMNMSLVFLTQRLFVNDEYSRQTSQTCDYFALFKNPRNPYEIRALAKQERPGNLIIVSTYAELHCYLSVIFSLI